MARIIKVSIEDDLMLERIASALSFKLRREILQLTNKKSYNIAELAKKLKSPVSTMAFHVKTLYDAGLVNIVTHKEVKGVSKIVSKKIDNVFIDLAPIGLDEPLQNILIEVPVGAFTDASVKKSCGLADITGIIGMDDEPGAFFLGERFKAGIIWFSDGFIEYKVPNYQLIGKNVCSMTISLEVCSEAPNYRIDWPSDITFSVNGHKLCEWTSPGDFGGRRGLLNPPFWSDSSSQYGIMKRIFIDETGVFLDADRVGGTDIVKLGLNEKDYFTFRIEIEENSKNKGGVNIFGKSFGDFDQDILFNIEYKERK